MTKIILQSVVLRSFVPLLVLEAQKILKFNSTEQFLDNNFCVRLKKQELTEEEYIEQKEEYLKTGDAKIIIYALNVRHSDAIHLEEMQVMTEETRQQNDGKLFKKLPLLCEQIGIGTLTVSEYLHRNGFFIDK